MGPFDLIDAIRNGGFQVSLGKVVIRDAPCGRVLCVVDPARIEEIPPHVPGERIDPVALLAGRPVT